MLEYTRDRATPYPKHVTGVVAGPGGIVGVMYLRYVGYSMVFTPTHKVCPTAVSRA